MRKYLICNIALLILLSFSVYGKAKPTSSNDRVKAFIQVWGIVKYRSPNSAQGKFNADSVFLASINKVKNADDKQFNVLVSALLEQNPGKPEPEKKVFNTPELLTKNIDYRWIKNRIFKPFVKKQLLALSQTYNPGKQHHFISELWYENEVPNENAYADYTFNKSAMNLLALAKAWNAAAYLFPYRYVTDQKWEQILQQMIPVFNAVRSRADYEKSVLLLEVALDDTHAAGFVNKMNDLNEVFDLKYYPPFAYKIYKDQVLVTAFFNDSLAAASGLKKGDLIVSINSTKTKQWLQQRALLLPASNKTVKDRSLEDFNAIAFGGLISPEVNVKVNRGGKYLNFRLSLLKRNKQKDMDIVNRFLRQRAAKEMETKHYEELPGDVALIRAGSFYDKNLPSEKEAAAFMQNLNNKKAIIFDMREYPQTVGLFYYYLPMALGRPAFKFARYYEADKSNPGAFALRDGVEDYLSKDIKPTLPLFKGKIVILTNVHTQSMGEWFTMMLRQITPNAVIIGSQTAGADGDLKRLTLPGGYKFIFTGNGIFYRDGKETQRIGILPDVKYEPGIAELVSERDEQLEKAVEYLKGRIE